MAGAGETFDDIADRFRGSEASDASPALRMSTARVR
jgi:hypothetical protein